ncbi:MAG: glycosyltransferase [Bacteroidota bacterium]
MQPHISIVSPVYRAEKIVDKLVSEIIRSIEPITTNYEIILVEDGSPDNSWGAIERNCQQNPKIVGIRLSRNFGQHYAITAGLDASRGEWIIVMDCDLQDRPDQFHKLYEATKTGAEIVLARRVSRQDGFFKRLSSNLFYRVFNYLTGVQHDRTVANFGIYHRKVIDSVNQMREVMRSFPAQLNWVGFERRYVDVEHGAREEGSTTYNWSKLINLALDTMLAYSDKPLRLTVKLGLTISFLAIVFALYNIIRYFNGTITVPGFASLIVSIWFLTGLTIFVLGIIGLYLGKVFESVKGRPIYLIRESLNHSIDADD